MGYRVLGHLRRMDPTPRLGGSSSIAATRASPLDVQVGVLSLQREQLGELLVRDHAIDDDGAPERRDRLGRTVGNDRTDARTRCSFWFAG